MAESDRGIHPDLVEEVAAERTATDNGAAVPTRGRGRRGTPPTPTPPAGGEAPEAVSSSPSPDGASPESGEDTRSTPQVEVDWRQAQSDEEAFKLLAKKLPSDVLQKDETLSGLIGSRADIRARDILRQQERDRLEQAKREAAANNDLYTLGELAQREYQQAAQQQDGAAQLQPFMLMVQRWQAKLPQAVQDEVAGKTYGEGKPFDVGFEEYLQSTVNSLTKLGIEAGLRERESALRKSILSEINGSEPVPEREGGTPARVRVVTDEQIAAMSLAEYDALFDENGHPKPGVQHRSTRGIPIQRQ
jgi:hypothetical protein